ncbi:MAG: ferritin [Chloroflexota bacterium]|nr:ferritin [Chloroflexota bacterium]
MITERLSRLLIEQIGHELKAHQLYMGIALYFERQSLDRWGKLFRDQSVEEAQHATRIMDFLTDNEVSYDLPALKAATTRYPSAAAAAQAALESERRVSGQFQQMSKAALEEGDHTAYQFVQWFINEQVEEERKVQALIDLINSGINLFQAQPLLDSFE